MKLSGTARNLTISQEGIAGTLLGLTVFHFILVTESEISLPTGNTTLVPVRFESYLRAPSFEGLRLEIEGSFDIFDSLFQPTKVVVHETGMTIKGAKRLGLKASILIILATATTAYGGGAILRFIWGNIALAVFEVFHPETLKEWWEVLVVILLTIVSLILSVVGVIAGVALTIYVSKVAVPTILETAAKFVRRYTEY